MDHPENRLSIDTSVAAATAGASSIGCTLDLDTAHENSTRHLSTVGMDKQELMRDSPPLTLSSSSLSVAPTLHTTMVDGQDRAPSQSPTLGPAEQQQQSEVYYPDGGYGWVIVVAVWIICFSTMGILTTWGVFQGYFIQIDAFPDADARHLSWVGSIGVAALFSIGPMIVILISRFGVRWTLAMGTILCVSSMIGASFATQYWHLYITQGLLLGLGSCVVYFTSLTVLTRYFNKHRTLASAIALSGSSIGTATCAPLMRWMLVAIGYRYAALILAGSCLVLLGASCCIVKPFVQQDTGRLTQEQGPEQEERVLDEKCVSSGHAPSSPIVQLLTQLSPSVTPDSSLATPASKPVLAPSPAPAPAHLQLDFTLFRQPRYVFVLAACIFSNMGLMIPLILGPSYAVHIGLTPQDGALMLTINAGVGLPVRVLVGHIADRFGILNTTLILNLLSALGCYALWFNAKTFATFAIYMVWYGALTGSIIPLFPVAASKIVPQLKDIPSAMAFVFFAHSVGMLVGAPIAQQLVDLQGGSFDGCICFTGSVYLISGLLLIVARVMSDRRIFVRL